MYILVDVNLAGGGEGGMGKMIEDNKGEGGIIGAKF